MGITNRKATTGDLIGNLIIGAILGVVLTVTPGIIGWLFYNFGPASPFICLSNPILWLLAAIGGTANAAVWLPLGTLVGAILALCRLHLSKGIPKTLFYSTGGILLALGLIVLGFLLAPPGHQDRTTIAARYTEFHESYNDGDYGYAYTFMSPTYRQTHTVEEFRSDFDFLGVLFGEPLEPDYSVRLSGDKAYLCPGGQRWSLGLLWSGHEFELEKIEEVWYLTGEYEFYLD